MRRAALLLLTLLTWSLAGLVAATPAAAHATLVSTDPGEGARVAAAPATVTLTFTESVSVGAGYARVLGAQGDRVDSGATTVDGQRLTIALRSGLPDGGYLVTYRVISADSHPVSGAYSFVVGDGELLAAGAGDAERSDPGVAVALPLIRWIGFAGLALAIGVPALAAYCWPGGWASRRLSRLASAGALAVALTAVLSFLLQGPYAAGVSLGSLLDPGLLSVTASSVLGGTLIARAVLALALAVVLRPVWAGGTPPSGRRLALAAVLATGLVLSTAAMGHPVAGQWPALAVTVAAVHVAAMALWLGGLAGLLAGVLRPATPAVELADVLPRFSRLAFAAVVALVVTGTVQSIREVGSPTALFVTTYGWVLVAKLAVVVVVLGTAGVSRVWVQQRLGVRRARPPRSRGVTEPAATARERLQAEGAAEHVPALRRSVLIEFALAAVVLALSAVLVATPPARSAVAQPVDVLLPLEGSIGASGSVQLSVVPARPGPSTVHVYLFDDAGRLTQPAGIEVTLTERAQEIGPLDVTLQPAGPGHYVSDGLAIPGAGTWTLAVSVRVDEFTATAARTDFPVR